jgi:hypothetical protein
MVSIHPHTLTEESEQGINQFYYKSFSKSFQEILFYYKIHTHPINTFFKKNQIPFSRIYSMAEIFPREIQKEFF